MERLHCRWRGRGLVALLAFSLNAWSQWYPMKYLSIEDGLPQSTVQALCQDRAGYMWLGTQQGVVRFDGLHVQAFGQKQPAVNAVRWIMPDVLGGVWIAADNGVFRFSPEGTFVWTEAQGLPSDSAWHLVADGQGRIWVATDNGLGMFYLKDDEYRYQAVRPELLGQKLRFLAVKAADALYVASTSAFYLCQEGAPARSFTGVMGSLIVKRLVQDGSGNLWMGTDRGLKVLKDGALHDLALGPGLDVPIAALLVDDRQNLWVGTEHGAYFGRLVADIRAVTFKHLGAEHGLNHPDVYAITQDREGGIWFGTEIGACQLKSLAFTNYSKGQGLSDNVVWSVAPGSDGDMIFGTDRGVALLDGRGHFRTLSRKDGLVGEEVRATLVLPDGTLWLGTKTGLSRYRAGRFDNYTEAEGLSDNFVRALCSDKDGRLWVATDGGGVSIWDGAHFTYLNQSNGLPHNRVYALCEVGTEGVCLGTEQGLVWVAPSGIKHFGEREGLPHHRVLAVRAIDETLWIGTDRGLARMDGQGHFQHFGAADGLADETCYFVQPDLEGHLWIGTNKGIVRFDGQHFETFTRRHGLSFDEANVGASALDAQGSLWFGTYNGITHVVPRDLRANLVPPPIYLTDVLVHDRPITLGERPLLHHRDNYLRFQYAGLCLSQPEAVRYRYMLEGLDTQWQEGNVRSVQYTSLAPGPYTFLVEAVNDDGVASSRPARLHFYIEPPYWQTWWFRCLVVALLGGALWWRLRDLDQRNRILARETVLLNREISEEKAIKLVQEAQIRLLHSQMNPHFLHNALTNAIYFAESAPNKTKQILTLLARVLRQTFRSTGAGRSSLADEMALIRNYLEIQAIRFQDRLKFDFRCNMNELPTDLTIPCFLVQPLVENAVIHGFEENLDGVDLGLACHLDGDELTVTVSNNGKPLNAPLEAYLADDHALGNINKRMQLLFGRDLGYFYCEGRHHFQLVMKVEHENSLG